MAASKVFKFTGVIECMTSNVYGLHIKVPSKIANALLQERDRVVIRLTSIHSSETWQAGLLSMGNNQRYLLMSRERCKKLKLKLDDEVAIALSPDQSKYGIALPEEMEELLRQDEKGSTQFHSLTIGKQRSLLHIIGKPKNPSLRLQKAITVLEYLKKVGGKLDFKELNEALRSK